MGFNELVIDALEKAVPEVTGDFKANDRVLAQLDNLSVDEIVKGIVEDSDIEEVVFVLNEIGVSRGIEITLAGL